MSWHLSGRSFIYYHLSKLNTMNLLKKSIYFFVLLSFVVVASCSKKEDSKPLTTAQKMAKQWKVSAVTGGSLTDFANYRITFTADANGVASTYTQVSGGSPISLSAKNSSGNGSWTLEGNDTQLFFDKGSSKEFMITLVSVSETSITVKIKVPKEVDKTEPEYTITLIPA